jgi:hypothetical protein
MSVHSLLQCENSKKNIAKRGEITFDHEADFRIEWKDLATVQRSTARYGKWDGGKSKSSTTLDGGKKLCKGPEIVTQHIPEPFWDT